MLISCFIKIVGAPQGRRRVAPRTGASSAWACPSHSAPDPLWLFLLHVTCYLHFSICACHPCAGAMLIFSAPDPLWLFCLFLLGSFTVELGKKQSPISRRGWTKPITQTPRLQPPSAATTCAWFGSSSMWCLIMIAVIRCCSRSLVNNSCKIYYYQTPPPQTPHPWTPEWYSNNERTSTPADWRLLCFVGSSSPTRWHGSFNLHSCRLRCVLTACRTETCGVRAIKVGSKCEKYDRFWLLRLSI